MLGGQEWQSHKSPNSSVEHMTYVHSYFRNYNYKKLSYHKQVARKLRTQQRPGHA